MSCPKWFYEKSVMHLLDSLCMATHGHPDWQRKVQEVLLQEYKVRVHNHLRSIPIPKTNFQILVLIFSIPMKTVILDSSTHIFNFNFKL